MDAERVGPVDAALVTAGKFPKQIQQTLRNEIQGISKASRRLQNAEKGCCGFAAAVGTESLQDVGLTCSLA